MQPNGAECDLINEVCQCDLDHIDVSLECVLIPEKIGESCTNDTDCRFIDGSICFQNECVCIPEDWILNPEMTKYLLLAENIGDFCEIDIQCAKLEETICQVDNCMCKASFTSNLNQTRCLTIAENLGDVCEESNQCIDGIGLGSDCINGSCECLGDLIPSDVNRKCLAVSLT